LELLVVVVAYLASLSPSLSLSHQIRLVLLERLASSSSSHNNKPAALLVVRHQHLEVINLHLEPLAVSIQHE
jgi:hypothetical protein